MLFQYRLVEVNNDMCLVQYKGSASVGAKRKQEQSTTTIEEEQGKTGMHEI